MVTDQENRQKQIRETMEKIKRGDDLPVIPGFLPCPDFSVGEIINGQYEVKELFHGSTGDVYHCYDKDNRKDVALKTIIGDGKKSRDRLSAFTKEVKKRIRLPLHPNVLAFDRIIVVDGYEYIISEWIFGNEQYGNSLSDFLENNTVTQEEFINMLIQICYGLQHCCKYIEGFVYGDLKPDNILVSDDDILKLSDYSDGFTAMWASPEQLNHETVDARSDIYSLAKIAGNIQGRIDLFSKDPEVTEEVDHLLSHCLKEKEARPNTIDEVLDELLRICNAYSIKSYEPVKIKQSFRDSFNRCAAQIRLFKNADHVLMPDVYWNLSSILPNQFSHISMTEYMEYTKSEDRDLIDAWNMERKQDIQGAINKLLNSSKLLGKNKVYLELARLYLRANDAIDAMKCYEAAILNGGSLEAYDLKANLLLEYSNVFGVRPEIPVLISRLRGYTQEKSTGYLANRAIAKYYLLSSILKSKIAADPLALASSYFRKSLQYPGDDDWRTLYYYGLAEHFRGNEKNAEEINSLVCKIIESDDYTSDPDKCTKLLFT